MASNHANPELAEVEVQGFTRQAFILRGALAAGAAYGTAAVTPYIGNAMAQSSSTDVDILNFALTLEFLEADFYTDAPNGRRVALKGAVGKMAKEFGSNEQEHVDALTATIKKLGGTPVKKPTFKFPDKDEKSFLKLAQTLEDTGVSAYNGAGPAIKSVEVLGAAGSIVQIEARHAAAIRLLNGANPAPDAFDKTLEMDKVLAAVKPFIKA